MLHKAQQVDCVVWNERKDSVNTADDTTALWFGDFLKTWLWSAGVSDDITDGAQTIICLSAITNY